MRHLNMAIYAAELDLPCTAYHETGGDPESVKKHNVRPIQRLQRLGLLGPGLVAVHVVHVEPAEIDLLAAHGCHVAHCPASNLKLANGIAPVIALRRAGVNVGIGTDSAASNNRLDLFGELRLAALLAKGSTGDAAAAVSSGA